ncbi:hypothetical protein NC653_025525 [Populus alba x Populus x berolinensis]|uniref:Uncharacterized protein n=1 Tax=Populus alba x Populus x berolinensis TaxID=444605 RepID=A0AAD6MCF7_9ROSI|nr:hypothetical protein NC653_025525 [Populus alba x Populus x berolinensis]
MTPFWAQEHISMGRVGDDFWFEEPNGDPMGMYWLQGVHMIHLWRGQFIQPDWDMFQSDHLCAESPARSRAICGGLVYVTDKDGHRNFDLLKKLVLPDGNISDAGIMPFRPEIASLKTHSLVARPYSKSGT